MLLPTLPIDELRRRVREAEALLRVAKSHAREEHDGPDAAAYATQRITTLLGEVDGLFPGLHDPYVPDPNIDRLVQQLTAAAEAAREAAEGEGAEEAETEGLEGEAEDEQEDDEEEDEAVDEEEAADEDEAEDAADDDGTEDDEISAEDDEAWEIDYGKLARAIENEQLMSAIPEPARAAFRTVARHLVETHERHELMQRISDGIGELSALTQKNAEEARRRVALALTFEDLANRRKA